MTRDNSAQCIMREIFDKSSTGNDISMWLVSNDLGTNNCGSI